MTIPEKFMALIRAFLANRHTGQIVLHIKDGQILVVDFTQSMR